MFVARGQCELATNPPRTAFFMADIALMKTALTARAHTTRAAPGVVMPVSFFTWLAAALVLLIFAGASSQP